MNRFIALLAPAMAAALLCPPAGATVGTPTYSTYSFTGLCRDCDGFGIGRLTLQNYYGGTLSATNFVEFTYTSNLLPAVDLKSVSYMGGSLSVLPGSNNVNFGNYDASFMFYSMTNGFWCDGASCLADDGPSHVWALATAVAGVPEPATWAMMAIGFGAIGAAVRQRRTVRVRFG